MLETPTTPREGETTTLWLIKVLTGPILVVIAFIHLWVNHTLGSADGNLLTFEEVVRYYQNPLIPLMEAVFLVTVITHSLLGIRSVILDLKPGRALKMIDWLLLLLGGVAVAYGIWLLLAITSFT